MMNNSYSLVVVCDMPRLADLTTARFLCPTLISLVMSRWTSFVNRFLNLIFNIYFVKQTLLFCTTKLSAFLASSESLSDQAVLANLVISPRCPEFLKFSKC